MGGSGQGVFYFGRTLAARLSEEFRLSVPSFVSPLGHTGANFALPVYDPDASPHFLYIGSLHRWKGLETAFEATKELGIDFDVIGDGGGLARTKELCRERGWAHVKFHGSKPPNEVIRFYRPGSICLLPLSNEEIARSFTSPLKLFEYMAAARPIAAGDLPSTREILTDGEQARLVEVANARAWRAAIQELLANRALALRLARNARQLAELCTWEKRAAAIVPRLGALTF